MRYRPFGNTGIRVSEVSLGGAYIGGPDPERERENAVEIVRRADELGINYIDTAPLYGRSEALFGAALEAAGTRMHVATKVGFDPKDFDYRRDSALRSLERSLKRLRISRLFSAQIHQVSEAGWQRILERGGTLEGLREAQKRGLCEHIGITDRAIPLLAKLARTGEFETLLVFHDYHPCSQKAAETVIPAAAASGMGIVVATVLAGGLFSDEPRRKAALRNLQDPGDRAEAEAIISRLRDEPGTVARNAFRYVLADPRVSTISSGAATAAELGDVARASEMGPLRS
ncbi:MAG: aldo/keto reductase [Candidatus Latescibacteria bacterium]|nr:aldo/keto reductase [Candidatus Latescibacterota bacterium]